MSNIFKVMSGGADRNRERVKTFLGKAEGADSSAEQRALEEDMLEPYPLEKWSGEKPVFEPLADRTVKLIFPNGRSVKLFRKYFRCAEFLGFNTTDTRMLIDLLKHLEDGRLKYNKDKRVFYAKKCNNKREIINRARGNKKVRKRVIR